MHNDSWFIVIYKQIPDNMRTRPNEQTPSANEVPVSQKKTLKMRRYRQNVKADEKRRAAIPVVSVTHSNTVAYFGFIISKYIFNKQN